LSTELTDIVIDLLDNPVTSVFYGESLERVVDALEALLRAHPPTPTTP
jgi:hypothetical protein